MATITSTPIKTFVSGETVTPAKLNELSQSTVALTAGTIVNADVSASAAIAKSKLALANEIVNADIKSDAAIAHSKLANITAGQVLLGNASNVPTATSLTGDVTVSNAGVTAIAAGVVVTADIAAAAITATKLDGVAKDGAGANLAVGTAPTFGCRAWVNFDGTKNTSNETSTANTNRLIRASGNVSSVLRTAAGVYTVTFATAMEDNNYAAVFGGHGNTSTSTVGYTTGHSFSGASGYLPLAESIQVRGSNGANGTVDLNMVTLAIFR